MVDCPAHCAPHLALTPTVTISAAKPFPGYSSLLREGAVLTSPQWSSKILTRYADVRRAFMDSAGFSSAAGVGCQGPMDPPTLLDLDQPAHDRQRRIVARWFSRGAVGRSTSALRATLTEVIGSAELSDGTDLMPELERVPVAALCALLGIPLVHVTELTAAVQRVLHETSDAGAGADHLTAVLAGQADRGGDGPLARLGHRTDPTGFRSWVMLLFLGGQEPLSTLSGAALLALAQGLTTVPDPDSLDLIIEETARLVSPTQFMFRQVTRPVTIDQTRLEPGTRVLLSIGAANLDEAVFPDPDQFRLDRPPGKPISYGSGPHVCLGRWLARTVVTIAVDLIWRRLPEAVRLDPTWVFSDNVRRISALTVRTTGPGEGGSRA